MADKDVKTLQPSKRWCQWQAFKGTNPRTLSISDADLRGKWVLLTGGNSGIGREASLQFAKWGANIIIGCRDPPPREMHPDAAVKSFKEAALTAGHEDTVIEWWKVDMSDLKSVEAFGKLWLESGRPLDILANNAGTAGVVKKTIITGDGFELVHQVNFISHVLLTLILLPSIARAAHPRIICSTSCMQYSGIFDLSNANEAGNSYANNKLYFQTWLTELQDRMAQHDRYKHVVIHGIHPGFVRSNIWGSLRDDSDQATATAGKKSVSLGGRILNFLLGHYAIDEQQGSLAITNVATKSEWGVDGGRYANRIWEEVPMPHTKDPGCRKQVWDFVGGKNFGKQTRIWDILFGTTAPREEERIYERKKGGY